MLCIPIIARNTERAINKVIDAEKHADISEVRLDLMDSFELDQLLEAARKPVIVTYRSKGEGGKGLADPSQVADYLISAAGQNAEYIDLELSMPSEWRNKVIAGKGNSQIIVSTHIFDCTPPEKELYEFLDKSIDAGGDIVKIVTMANTLDDNLRMLGLVSEAQRKEIKIIAFCMGAKGRMSRVFSLLMGGYLTFTSLETGEESAPGQIPVKEMKKLMEYFSG